MMRPYCWIAFTLIFLLPLHLTLGELQRSSASVAKSIGKVRGESSPSSRVAQGEVERPGRIRTHLAGGFIDDAVVHKNGDDAARLPPSGTVHRARANIVAGSGRKAAVHGTSGPIHTYIKTDKNANFKWGVRHFVGAKYAR